MTLTRENVKTLVAAKQQVSDGSFAMWNLRLELMLRAGNLPSAFDLMSASVEDHINNCGCNVQCGALNETIGAETTSGLERA